MRTLKEHDNVETKKLLPILNEFLQSIITPIEEDHKIIEEFEWVSRSGFSAHNHNRGGMDLIAISDYRTILGSGYGDKEVLELASEADRQAREYIKKDHPELVEDTEEYYEVLDENLSGDYSQIAFRVRTMYEGNGLLMVYVGYDDDAPYFRWAKPSKEYKIKFKTKIELRKKLNKLLTKLNKD